MMNVIAGMFAGVLTLGIALIVSGSGVHVTTQLAIGITLVVADLFAYIHLMLTRNDPE